MLKTRHKCYNFTSSNFICRKDQRDFLHKTAENNRNFSLLFAQISFLVLPGKWIE
jgi:hypothetical protein